MRIRDFRTSKGVVGMVLLVGSLMGSSYQMQDGTQLVSSSFLAPDVEPPAPSSNIAPSPDYQVACFGEMADATAMCDESVLRAINNAHEIEGIPTIALPDNYPSLPNDIQQFIIVNEERITHNVPPLTGILRSLNNIAMQGAIADTDPSLPPSVADAANWSAVGGALESDYGYMYNDGWGGSIQNTSNISCTSATAFGCWGHRYNILFNPGVPLSFGAATVDVANGSWDSTQVISEQLPSPGDQYIYTWADYEASLSRGRSTTYGSHFQNVMNQQALAQSRIHLSGTLLGVIMPWIKDVSQWSVGLWHHISNAVSRWF